MSNPKDPTQVDLFLNAPTGMETVDPAQDLTLIRLAVAQRQSPQVDPDEDLYIPDLKPGHWYDPSSGTALGAAIHFLPAAYRKRYVEWGDREAGEGIQGFHDASVLNRCQPGAHQDPRRRFLDNGNHIRETAYFFGWLVDMEGGTRQEDYLAMSSTQLRAARQWLALARGERLQSEKGVFQAPLCYRLYRLTCVRQSNSKGSWFSPRVERTEARVYDVAEAMGVSQHSIVDEATQVNATVDEHPAINTGGSDATVEALPAAM